MSETLTAWQAEHITALEAELQKANDYCANEAARTAFIIERLEQRIAELEFEIADLKKPDLRDVLFDNAGMLEGMERAAEIIAAHALKYPMDVFTEPPPGEHGKSVDGCSARAIRYCCKVLREAIREEAAREKGEGA